MLYCTANTSPPNLKLALMVGGDVFFETPMGDRQ
jgi:hypothetical protein